MLTFRRKKNDEGYAPGITPRSIAAMVFCILMASAYTNYSCTFLAEHYQIVEAAIPFPAILAILFASLFTGLMALLTKRRLLTRPEFVCVAFATMISAPRPVSSSRSSFCFGLGELLLSRTTHWLPSLRTCRTRWLPVNPVPPVTRILLIVTDLREETLATRNSRR